MTYDFTELFREPMILETEDKRGGQRYVTLLTNEGTIVSNFDYNYGSTRYKIGGFDERKEEAQEFFTKEYVKEEPLDTALFDVFCGEFNLIKLLVNIVDALDLEDTVDLRNKLARALISNDTKVHEILDLENKRDLIDLCRGDIVATEFDNNFFFQIDTDCNNPNIDDCWV